MNSTIPKYVARLFWDTDVSNVDIQNHSKYIIEKVFLLGDIEATKWIAKTYGIERLKEVALHSKVTKPYVKNYYAKLKV